jgi:hypothetical protein
MQELDPPEVRRCRSCGASLDSDSLSLDLGLLPPCNRFARAPGEVPRHRLKLVGCAACGLIQVDAPAPVADIVPRVPWIRYNEPAHHLDDLVERLRKWWSPETRTVLGVGPFEDPLHEALARQGLETARAPGPESHSPGFFPYLETWQQELVSGALVERMRAGRGGADIVTFRYLIEHCHSPVTALRQLGAFLSDNGLLIVEAPDSSKFLASRDYSFPWEEHVCYFTEPTFVRLCRQAGYDILEILRYPGDLEDSLVVVLRAGAAAGSFCKAAELGSFEAYCAAFEPTRSALRRRVAALAGPENNRLALFGVGHQAIMFANVFAVAKCFARVVDDDENKQGYAPPGFDARITSTRDLLSDPQIRTCLLAVSPRSEPIVRELLEPLRGRGVELRSIYAAAPSSIVEASK